MSGQPYQDPWGMEQQGYPSPMNLSRRKPASAAVWIGIVSGVSLLGLLTIGFVDAFRGAEPIEMAQWSSEATDAASRKPEESVTAKPSQPNVSQAADAKPVPATPPSPATPAALGVTPTAPAAAPATPTAPAAAPTTPATPAVPAAPAAPAAPGAPGVLKYAWNPDCVYNVRFNVIAEVAKDKIKVSGSTSYRPKNVDPATVGGSNPEGEGSGSAFVVRSDGVLLTCAHVVHGAVEITAELGGRNYAAKVVGYAPEEDLAVLKIEATGLPTVGLHDSSQVELGQEVRVVGFPLSDVLGESVKISRGTVAGIIDRKGKRLFQVDASVNPGNSGGPTVDERGRVVGVTNAKLMGESIDRVGFAIPAAQALAMLRQHNYQVPPPEEGQDLDGPALARRVTPAVAFIKVKIGRGGVGLAEQRVVDFSMNFNLTFDENSSRPPESAPFGMPSLAPPPPMAPSPFGLSRPRGISSSDDGRLIVDTRGGIEGMDGIIAAPLLPESLALVGIESLPTDGRKQWQTAQLTVIIKAEASAGSSPFDRSPSPYSRGPRRRPPGSSNPYSKYRPSPYGEPEERERKITVMPAIEEIRWEIKEESADGTVILQKEYELTTLHEKKEDPAFYVMKGSGTVVWDKKQGMPQKSKMKLTFTRRDLPGPIPLEFDYEVRVVDIRDATSKYAEGAPAPARPKPEEKRDPVRKIEAPGGSVAAGTTPSLPAPGSGLGALESDGKSIPPLAAEGKPKQPSTTAKKPVAPARPSRSTSGARSVGGSGGGLGQFDPD